MFVMAMAADDVVMLLLTEKELERAAKRAEKNPEDLPEHFAIIQGSNEEETILLDDTDVAEPKKSGGFLSWFFSPSN